MVLIFCIKLLVRLIPPGGTLVAVTTARRGGGDSRVGNVESSLMGGVRGSIPSLNPGERMVRPMGRGAEIDSGL